MTLIHHILPILAALLLAGPASAEIIRLKPAATVAMRQDVRLGDIATVTGDDPARAQKLADTIILIAAEKSLQLKSDDILLAIVSQGQAGSAVMNLQIAGARECSLTVGTAPIPTGSGPNARSSTPNASATTGTPRQAAQDAPVSGADPSRTPAEAAPTSALNGSLAETIRLRIQQELALPTDDIVVRFDTISPLLEQPIAAPRKWLCRPLTRTFLGTVPFEAQLVDGTKVVERLNVQAAVQQMQLVPVLTTRVSRGDVVPAAAVRMERLPLDRKMKTLFSREAEVIGLESQKDLDSGTMLDQRDFRPAFMTHRNEPVTVVYLSGALSVQVRARALADAKLHDRVRVRNEATHEEYTATVIGKDLAVAGGTLTPDQEKQLREGM